MSIEFEVPPRMPQPEQWLSEHDPWVTVIILILVIGGAGLVGWLAN